MSYYRDCRYRKSVSYKVKRWFLSDHTKEIKKTFFFIGEFLASVLWFGLIFIIPHIFH